MELSTERRKQIQSTAIGLIAPLLWSSFSVLTLVVKHVPLFTLLAIAFTSSFFLSTCVWCMKKRKFFHLQRLPIKYVAIGVASFMIFNSFFVLALRTAPAAEGFLVAVSWPVLSIILAAIILKEIIRFEHVVGCVFAFSGIAYLTLRNGVSSFEYAHIFGYSLAILASLVWSFYSVFCKKYNFPSDLVGVSVGASALIAWVLSYFFEPFVHLNLQDILIIVYLGLGPAGIAYYAWNYGVQKGDIRVLCVLSFLGHLGSVAMLIFFGFSEPGPHIYIASFLIIGGSFVAMSRLFFERV